MDQQQITIQADQALREVSKIVEVAPLPKAQHIYLDQCIQALRMIVGEWSAIKENERKQKLIEESKQETIEAEKKSP